MCLLIFSVCTVGVSACVQCERLGNGVSEGTLLWFFFFFFSLLDLLWSIFLSLFFFSLSFNLRTQPTPLPNPRDADWISLVFCSQILDMWVFYFIIYIVLITFILLHLVAVNAQSEECKALMIGIKHDVAALLDAHNKALRSIGTELPCSTFAHFLF